jgi:hypothetical protein
MCGKVKGFRPTASKKSKGVDPKAWPIERIDRHHGEELGAGLDVISRLDSAVANDAFDWSDDGGVITFLAGKPERGTGLDVAR